MNPLPLFALCAFLVGLDALVVVPLAPAMAGDLGLLPVHAGWLVTAYSLAYALGAPLFGPLSDRHGRVPILQAGLVLFTLATAALAFAPDAVSALLLRGFAGLGAAAITPTLFALLGDSVPPERRGRATGVVYGAMISATVLGVPVGSLVADMARWPWTFAGVAVAGLTALFLVGRRAGRLEPAVPAADASGHFTDTVTVTLSDRRVRWALLTTLLWYAALYGMFANVGVLYSLRFGLDTTRIGLVILVAGSASVVGNLLGGRLADQFNPWPILGLAALCAGGAVLLLAHLDERLLQAALGHTVWAFLVGLGSAPLMALVTGLRSTERATVLALNSTAMYLGMSLASGLAARLLGEGGFPLVGTLSAAIYFGVSVLARRLAPSAVESRAA
ncbi:MFS transporter [Thioalbus denitrificans]|uniref:Putative MFS family arabinose efflux permease n=1 Tax=Thioalbus denitrificans TaxID=547122 RepID=A0A369CET7_9GAMM|nr:MFS transporter [Thioalbus denitrificans]RCX31196.1 putative MFS family arabinose efflux permease [Thioalbus denitrificans]